MRTRTLPALGCALAMLGTTAPAAGAIEVGMNASNVLLIRDVSVAGEDNRIKVRRNMTEYEVEWEGGPYLSLHGDEPSNCQVIDSGLVIRCTPASGAAFAAHVVGGAGNDIITFDDPYMAGAVTSDDFYGGLGDDTLQGGGGDDRIFGEGGSDQVFGGAGSDQVDGGHGNDQAIDGNDGADQILGGIGADVLADTGSTGADTLHYGSDDGRTTAVGVTLTPDNGQRDDGSADDGPQGERDLIGPGIENYTGTSANDVMNGAPGAVAETISGLGDNDVLDGGHGADTLRGGAGVDTLKARDGEADPVVDCDSGTSNSNAGESAEVDAADVDQNVLNCETVQRPSAGTTDPGTTPGTGGQPGGGGPSEPDDSGAPPRCLKTADMYLRPDYDVDRALAGKMRIQVYVPAAAWRLHGFLSRTDKGRTGEELGALSSEVLGKAGLATLTLRLDKKFRSEFAGRSKLVLVNVVIAAPRCPVILVSDTVQLASKVDNSSPAVRNRVIARAAGTTIERIYTPPGGDCDPHNYIATWQSCPKPKVPEPDPCATNLPFASQVSVVGEKICRPNPKERPNIYTSDGLVQMNGLFIEPVGKGSSLTFDTNRLSFEASGGMKIYFKLRVLGQAPREIVLFQGSREFRLNGMELLMAERGFSKEADILGFKFAADLKWQFYGSGLKTTANLRLPQAFGGAEATVKLDIGLNGEISVETLHVVVPTVEVYGFKLIGTTLDYESRKDPVTAVQKTSWFGTFTLKLPQMGGGGEPPSFRLESRWEDGKFVSGGIFFSSGRQAFGNPAIMLDKVQGELTLGEPLRVKLKARVAFGPTVLAGVPSEVAALEGTLAYTAPSGGSPGVFEFTDASLVFYKLPPGVTAAAAHGFLRYTTDGKFTFGGNASVDFGQNAFVRGNVKGSLADGKFNAYGNLKVRVAFTELDGAFWAANEGVAACARADKHGVGFTFDWQKKKLELFQGCGLADWIDFLNKSGRAAQAPPEYGFTVPAGLNRIAIEATGVKNIPDGDLIAPNGSRVRPVAVHPETKRTYWIVPRPVAGAWKVRFGVGHQIARLRMAKGIPADKVTAEVERDGKEIEVDYKSTIAKDESIVFYEKQGDFMRRLKETSKRTGDFDFKPADIKERKRELVAMVLRDGLPTSDELVVAKFAGFPAPLPTSLFPIRGISTIGADRPPVIRTDRKGGDVVLEWGLSGGADGYEVDVKHGDGRRQVLLVEGLHKTKLELKAVDEDFGFTARVRGFNEDFEFGQASEYTFKARRPDKPKPQRGVADPRSVGYLELG